MRIQSLQITGADQLKNNTVVYKVTAKLDDCDSMDVKMLQANCTGKNDFRKIIQMNQEGKNPLFGGAFNFNGKLVYVKKVIYNNPCTIVFWSDDTKTTAKCDERDTYSPETGLLTAVFKKLVGNKFLPRLVQDWLPETITKGTTCTLKDVRRKNK